MLIAGHIGITLAAAKYAPGAVRDVNMRLRPPRGIHTFTHSVTERLDDRALIFGSMLPDLLDKPIALFIAPDLVNHTLRNFGHTLLFAAVLLAVAFAVTLWKRQSWPVTLALASAGHLVLDTMWYSHRILLWPFAVSAFEPSFIHEWGPSPMILYLGAEAIGLIIICWIALRLIVTRKVRHWTLTGRAT